jgi:spore coat polysaccharide biosynthesis protein SpsF (cytidylyltransferase family)
LQFIDQKNKVVSSGTKTCVKFDVQANLWNGDPDIDAICRMIYKPECLFDNKDEWFTTDNLAPFNSQNTILKRDALKHYFMFDKVGRMDDIFGSYILQKKGFKCVFVPPTVYQHRNEHDLTVDMKKEYIGYENVVNILENDDFVPKESYNRYLEVIEHCPQCSI